MSNATGDRSPLVHWSDTECRLFDAEPFVTRHRIHRFDRFEDPALVELIEKCPRENLQIFTMGTDPCSETDWTPVDTTGASGVDVMRAVTQGRLWVKLLRVDLFDDDLKGLVETLYQQISENFIGFHAYWLRPLLLISSPRAMVYYHADAHPTMLWHIRGSKRVWIYPANDPRFISPALMEDIFSGEADEEIPFEKDYDRYAQVYDMKPGDLLVWPLNAPHRITNSDSLNVSLSVPFGTALGEQRAQLYQANRFLRTRFGLPTRSTREDRMTSVLKRLSYRAARRLGLTPKPNGRVYMTNLRVDASSRTGVCPIPDGPVHTPF